MRKEGGAVLVYVLVATVLVGLVAAAVSRTAFSGRVLQMRAEAQGRARLLLLGARARAEACLFDPVDAGRSCAPTAAQRACLPIEAEGRRVEFSFEGSQPECRIRISLAAAQVR
ncbi:MAG: hypothetical protein HY928_14675 [Elusimicrobia bacterium]|nr:hypothetical protein [Elusimicrobiota bacterium]